VAAFETASQPVYSVIAQNPSNAELIAAIRELKAKTSPLPGAGACEPDTAQTSIDANAAEQAWSEDRFLAFE
jgi:hypothetical protein